MTKSVIESALSFSEFIHKHKVLRLYREMLKASEKVNPGHVS